MYIEYEVAWPHAAYHIFDLRGDSTTDGKAANGNIKSNSSSEVVFDVHSVPVSGIDSWLN